MKNYQATIGYKAVFCINVKADSETEAKTKALDLFKKDREKSFPKCDIQDDNFAVNGILDLDETFDMLY